MADKGDNTVGQNLDHRAAVTPFRVFARVRPFIPEELEAMRNQGTGQLELRSIIEMRGKSTYLLDPKNDYQPKLQFEFDGSWWSIPESTPIPCTFHDQQEHRVFVSQSDVYNTVGASCVDDVVQGFNSCIMTYGQTGSGKTFTMMGNYETVDERGVISRLCHDLFAKVKSLRANSQPTEDGVKPSFTVEVNFIEVYMEKVRDLLDPNIGRKHSAVGHEDDGKIHESKVRQHPVSGPYVEGVTKYTVETWDECCKLLERGSRQRRTCANVVHNQSSRSHAIFQITLIQEVIMPRKDKYSEPVIKRKAGRINLVDLAGSERGGATDYVKESAMINKSLLALRRVIDTLTMRQTMIFEEANAELMGKEYVERPKPQVPFRDSVLTWILSDSIGGNAKTVMIATVSPFHSFYLDTLATLQWSHKARSLVTVVKANDMTSANKVIKGMKGQVEELNSLLSSQQQNVDNIRKELVRRQTMADELEAQIGTMKTDMEKVKRDHDLKIATIAAQRIQGKFRVHVLEGRIDAKLKACDSYRKNLDSIRKEIADAAMKTDAATTEMASVDQRKIQLQDKIDTLHTKLSKQATEEMCPAIGKSASLQECTVAAQNVEKSAKSKNKELMRNLAEAKRVRQEQQQDVNNTRDGVAADIAKTEKAIATANHSLANAEEDIDAERLKLEAEIAQLQAKIKLQDEMIPTLQSRLTELKNTRGVLSQECSTLRAENDKLGKGMCAKKLPKRTPELATAPTS